MDAVKFLQERSRMYESGAATPDIGLEDDYDPVIAVKVVEEWAAAHPRKTRQTVFLEQWPDADIDENGVVSIAPCSFLKEYRKGPTWESKCHAPDITCRDCCREFWMQEVE